MRYHLTLVRMAIIKKSTHSKCCRGCGGKGTLLHCWQEYKLITATMEESIEIPLKIRNKTTIMTQQSHSQANTLRKPELKKDTCTPMFVAVLFTITRTWKQCRCPLTDDWIKKQQYIYTMEYYSAMKRNAFESVPMRWMNLEPIIE